MKKLIIFVLFILLAFIAKAQYGSEFMLGGRINYIGGGKVWNGDKLENKGYTLRTSPAVGYFIYNNVALGTTVTYEYVTDDLGRQNTWEFIPYIRYYTPGGDARFFLELQGGYGLGTSVMKEGNDGKHHLWLGTLKPGLFIRFLDNFATEITISTLSYKDIWAKDKVTGDIYQHTKWDFEWLDFSFGATLVYEF
ncbi:MAG: hypothetical protein LIO65_00625 [Odoribacter sp.]|nr:hypothetical protein [Odoribacter sp.]